MIKLPDIRQQSDHDCGLTVARVLLRFLGRRPTAQQLSGLACDPVDGTDPRNMETFLRQIGLRVQAGSFTVENLDWLTSSGRPVVCLTTPAHGIGHYVVVAGIDGQTIHYQCPTEGPSRSGLRTWLKCWREVDRLGATYHQWGISAWRP